LFTGIVQSGGYILKSLLTQILSLSLAESRESRDRKAINIGRVLARSNEALESTDIRDFGFGVFSQWDEDGILQRLTKSVPPHAHTFIEIGVEDYSESNTRFLMMKDNWKGFIVDSSSKNMRIVREASYYWKYDLTAKASFVTAENVNQLISESGFQDNLGLLSLDIDGVDFHVLNAIENCRPHILVVEYNANFGPEQSVTVPYRPDFERTKAHYSNLYYGASLAAMAALAEGMGLVLVGTNSAGNNAFFVRAGSEASMVFRKNVQEAFTASLFREARDEHGRLTFDIGEGLKEISHLPLDLVTDSGDEVNRKTLSE